MHLSVVREYFACMDSTEVFETMIDVFIRGHDTVVLSELLNDLLCLAIPVPHSGVHQRACSIGPKGIIQNCFSGFFFPFTFS
jgi:hypothetical protein